MEYIDLLSCMILIPTIVAGLMVFVSFHRSKHKYSFVFLVLISSGLLNVGICSLKWLKSKFDLCAIHVYANDIATLPTFIFELSFAAIVVTLSKCKLNSPTIQISYIAFVSLSSLFIFYIRSNFNLCSSGVFLGSSRKPCDIKTFLTLQNDSFSPIVEFLCTYCSSIAITVVEYILIYFPSIFLIHGHIKNVQSKIVIFGEEKNCVWKDKKEEIGCNDCNRNAKLFRTMATFVFSIVYIVRPLILIMNLYVHFMTQDVTPSITLLVIYLVFIVDSIDQTIPGSCDEVTITK